MLPKETKVAGAYESAINERDMQVAELEEVFNNIDVNERGKWDNIVRLMAV